jgi:hypothetical protein
MLATYPHKSQETFVLKSPARYSFPFGLSWLQSCRNDDDAIHRTHFSITLDYCPPPTLEKPKVFTDTFYYDEKKELLLLHKCWLKKRVFEDKSCDPQWTLRQLIANSDNAIQFLEYEGTTAVCNKLSELLKVC